MSERGAEVRERLATMHELEEVLGAMRGMAAARIQQGERAQLAAQEYAAQVGAALTSLSPERDGDVPTSLDARKAPTLVVALCTDRGFVGALNEHILSAASEAAARTDVLVVGARGLAFAREQGLAVTDAGNMATHVGGIGDVADRIGDLILKRMATDQPITVDVVHPRRSAERGTVIERRRLLPVVCPSRESYPDQRPITMLPAPALLSQIAVEYVHARLFEFVAETFAATNTATLEVLQGAHTHLDEMIVDLRRTENVIRQENITAEVLEVISGRMKSVV
jgi:F-type H+-transporting ATPase subunit gamma